MKKPNLFILGGPKCGTTSVASWLSEHPEVFISNPKEPHYFLRLADLSDGSRSKHMTINEYESLFQNASHFPVVGEASTSYLLHSSSSVRKILKYSEEPKFIVCLRNPVEMAISLHAERIYQGEEDVLDFEDAWRLNDKRLHMMFVPENAVVPKFSCYKTACCLGEQLKNLLRLISEESIHFCVLDDIKENPIVEYKRLIEFLGLDYDGKENFAAKNSRKYRKSIRLNSMTVMVRRLKTSIGLSRSFGILNKIHQWNVGGRPLPPVTDELVYEMKETFKKDVELLGETVGRDFSTLWGYE
jgi:hypothetical protein